MSKSRLLASRQLLFEKLELRQMLSAASADFDGSLLVDGADLAIWEQGFGSTSAVHSQGDADLDGDVDGSDFLAWQRNFGSSVSQPSIFSENFDSVAIGTRPSGISTPLVGPPQLLSPVRRLPTEVSSCLMA